VKSTYVIWLISGRKHYQSIWKLPSSHRITKFKKNFVSDYVIFYGLYGTYIMDFFNKMSSPFFIDYLNSYTLDPYAFLLQPVDLESCKFWVQPFRDTSTRFIQLVNWQRHTMISLWCAPELRVFEFLLVDPRIKPLWS
jgi:hypothetical protein